MDIFNADAPATTDNPVELLVGEGKKFRTIEDLAKSKIEADQFIDTLKAELLQMRTDLSTRESVEDQIKRLSKPAQAPLVPDQARVEVKAPVLTEEALNQRIRETLEATTQEATAKGNLNAVTDALISMYGSEAKAAEQVAKIAQELGVTKKFLMESAATSPKLFFRTIGVQEPKTSSAAPRSDVNTEALRTRNAPSTTNFAPGTYEDLRTKAINDSKGNPVKALLDPKYLNETMNAALADPTKFFGAAA